MEQAYTYIPSNISEYGRIYLINKELNPIFTYLWNNVTNFETLRDNYSKLFGEDDIPIKDNDPSKFNETLSLIIKNVMTKIVSKLPTNRLITVDDIYNNRIIELEPLAKVVCVKVDKIRPKYNNLEIWMNDPNNVYIGRRGIVFIDKVRFPKEDSIWANPFKIDKDGNRDEVIEKYRKYILGKPELLNRLSELKGKTLGCWCSPEPCHGDILKELSALY